jgi:hypothetical protein
MRKLPQIKKEPLSKAKNLHRILRISSKSSKRGELGGKFRDAHFPVQARVKKQRAEGAEERETQSED